MTTISAIIPAYQASRTLGEALDSILQQSHSIDEIIVVDDGSTDGTSSVARQAGSLVEVIRQDNAGPAAALNRGLGRASGDFIAFLDADNIWTKTKTEMQVAAFNRRRELDVVAGHMSCFACPSMTAAEAATLLVPALPQPAWLNCALLLRRAAFDRVGPYDEALRIGYAIDWMNRARYIGIVGEMLPDIVYHRRIGIGTLSHRTRDRDQAMVEVARRSLMRRRGAARE